MWSVDSVAALTAQGVGGESSEVIPPFGGKKFSALGERRNHGWGNDVVARDGLSGLGTSVHGVGDIQYSG